MTGKVAQKMEAWIEARNFSGMNEFSYFILQLMLPNKQRLEKAQLKLNALTPPRSRGKRQITEESVLQEKIEKILKTHRVEGLLTVEYEKQVEEHTKYVGRGRGSKKRPQQVIKKLDIKSKRSSGKKSR
ncbi:hypothetical protein VU04_01270 [Desulfobulbus sp. TB]|nr:hypothetical protein [Desulfobulbus sp. TB]